MAYELTDAVDALTREVVFRSKCAEAIEATARELGEALAVEIDPARLAELMGDGRFFTLAVLAVSQYRWGPPVDGRSHRDAKADEVLGKLAALRAGKGGE